MVETDDAPDGRTIEARVASHIRALVLGGHLRPGDRIVAEAVAAELGVSRLPVRQALLHLDGSGLVEQRPHRGAIVPPPTGSARSEMHELLELRRRLEPWGASLAARHRTDEDLARIGGLIEDGSAALAVGDVATANVAHHGLLGAFAVASHHSVLVETLMPLHNRSSLIFSLLAGDALPDSWDHHRAVLRAVADQDPRSASHHVRTHLDEVDRALRRGTSAAG